MKKKIIPVIVVAILIVLIALGWIGWNYYNAHFVMTKDRVDLTEYFGVTSPDEILLIKDHEKMDLTAKQENDRIYLPYSLVYELNHRFYLDENDGILIYCTEKDLYSVNIEETENKYFLNHEPVATEYPVVKLIDNELYLCLDFVRPYLSTEFSYYEEPSRLCFTTESGTIQTQETINDTALRIRGGIKGEILTDLPAGTTLTLLEEGVDWNQVCDNTGFTGYVPKTDLGEVTETVIPEPVSNETWTHHLMDGPVCLLWHQVTNPDSNKGINNILPKTKAVNAVSPTWFYLNDNEGNLADLGSSEYVQFCHENGVQVWALISNFENPDVDTGYVLSHTTIRRAMVDQLMEKAVNLGVDGINLDFEAIDEAYGDDYVQLVRELSQKCDEQGLIFSVDTYVPKAYSAYYDRAEQGRFADYVIIMGYDEHYNGSDEGSVASLPYVRDGVMDTIAEGVDPAQIVLGMPFYTRLWKETPKTEAPSEEELASPDYVPYDLSSQVLTMATQNITVIERGAEVTWLEDLGQNYAQYQEGNSTYKIWMEDAASLEKKLEVVKESGIAGGAFWKAELETADVWDVIQTYLGQ